jgi:sulfatase maturation enzyme AslB (radical SAM superfamily)
VNNDPLKVIKDKTGIFSTELKHASLKNFKRLLTRPLKILDYLAAFFKYRMVSDGSLNQDKGNPAVSLPGIRLFGDFEELHDRIAGKKGDFKQSLEQIMKFKRRHKKFKLLIGLSRYNFARIKQIADLAISLTGEQVTLDAGELEIFPVQNLPGNFIKYVERISRQLDGRDIEISFFDPQLTEILNTVGLHAKVDPGREKELLRLLGIICEQVFIGPQTIVFDPFHRCNTKCQHCWVHTPSVRHPEEFLNRKFDFELFKKIIDDASQMKTDGIILQGDGEPLMYEQFMPMLRYARGKKLGILFFTNGILFDEEKAKEVIALGVNEIYCSSPAAER